MKQLEKLSRKQLGELLLAEGLVTQEQLGAAEQTRARNGWPLGAILVEDGMLDERDLARTVVEQFGLPFVQLERVAGNHDLETRFDQEEMALQRVVPLDLLGKSLVLAVAEMPDLAFLESIRERTGFTPQLFVTLLSEVRDRYPDIFAKLDQGEDRILRQIAAAAESIKLDFELIGAEEGELEWDPTEEDGGNWAGIFDEGDKSVKGD